ncbi:hypothetical protein B0H13DRAFT_2273176 [Mycena leptocephala]|nr:hypothetical protein B0H13DRAFT_2273176 [Mycena leptocephala]
MDGPSALPVTSHFLKPEQRVRLLRSTRKMEHLLGETPLFIDTSSPRTATFPVHESRPRAYIYAPPRSSSLGIYTPDAESPHASTSHISARPLLASPADELRNRRTRKMARIVRTLGENVPAELIFPATHSDPPRRPSTLSKRRSTRLMRASSAATRTGRRDSLVESEWRRETAPAVDWNRERAREREAPPMPEEEPDSSDRDSVSVYSALSGEPPLAPAPEPPKFGARTAPVVFEPLGPTSSRSHASLAFQPRAAGPSAASTDIGYDRGTHRREQGWSGEWVTMGEGLQNMNEVASRLRDLRLK